MSPQPIKYSTSSPSGTVGKQNTIVGITSQDYASQGGWFSGFRGEG